MFAVPTIVLNGAVGLSLLPGAARHREQAWNLPALRPTWRLSLRAPARGWLQSLLVCSDSLWRVRNTPDKTDCNFAKIPLR
jgi:hypothetical protein